MNAWLEDEYNNRLKVPGFEAIRDGWKSDAADYRARHAQAELSLKYGHSDRQVLDIFWPGVDRSSPMALFIHGGYWQALDKDWFSHLARGFNAHGIALALPSYDLCPHVALSVIVEQTRSAAGYLIATYGRNIYATGHSAGGHLAAMLMATDWAARDISGNVFGATTISGLFDLAPLLETSVNAALRLDAEQARALSPIYLPAPNGKLHAFVGSLEGEEYTNQSRRIAQAWDGHWSFIPGANHFTVIAPLTEPDSEMMTMIAGAISAH